MNNEAPFWVVFFVVFLISLYFSVAIAGFCLWVYLLVIGKVTGIIVFMLWLLWISLGLTVLIKSKE